MFRIIRASRLRHLKYLANQQETILTTLADIQAQTAAVLDAARKNADLTDSIKTVINGLRSQIDDLQKQVADLVAAGTATPEQLQSVSDNLTATLASIDADTAAEAVIAGTEADPNPAPAPDAATT